MPWPGSNADKSQKNASVRDALLRGIYEPEIAGPNVIHPGAVVPQGWYEERVAARMGYPTLVRHPTGPVGSYMRKVGSPNETPTDQYGQSWSSTAPQWMNVDGEWYNVARAQARMGEPTMIGGGPIGSHTTQRTQPTPLSAIPGMLQATNRPMGAGSLANPMGTAAPDAGIGPQQPYQRLLPIDTVKRVTEPTARRPNFTPFTGQPANFVARQAEQAASRRRATAQPAEQKMTTPGGFNWERRNGQWVNVTNKAKPVTGPKEAKSMVQGEQYKKALEDKRVKQEAERQKATTEARQKAEAQKKAAAEKVKKEAAEKAKVEAAKKAKLTAAAKAVKSLKL